MVTPMVDLAFVACIERGVLEPQGRLLFESIRRYGGRLANSPIYAYSPRRDREVGDETRAVLREFEVTHITAELNTACVEYGPANRVLAGAHAATHTDHALLCVIDSDTLFLRQPDALDLPADVDMRARLVDHKGCCTAGPGDPLDPYWRQLCALGGVDYEVLPDERTAVDERPIKASYNGGLVVVRNGLGILERCAELFLRSVEAKLVPRPEIAPFRTATGVVPRATGRWWGSSQAALSVAAWSLTRNIELFEPTYNYPAHLHHQAPAPLAAAWPHARHVHYHWMLDADALDRSPLLGDDTPLTTEQRAWLQTHLPLDGETLPTR